MARSTTSVRLAAVALGVAVVTACGTEESVFDTPVPNELINGNDAGNGQLGNSKGDGGPADELKGCATEQRKADPLPLDIVIMLDTSGSMSSQVAQGVSKYKAVSDAVAAFVTDSGSAGIGVGMQFFPVPTAGTPGSCATSADCPGATGPCTTKLCTQGGPLTFCDTKADCAPSANCVPAARCQFGQNTYCVNTASACGADANGFQLGSCQAQASGSCIAADSCNAADYAAPVVNVAMLPAAGTSIIAALAAKEPVGNTPTSEALQGAVDAASAYAAANPGHTVIALLATDGLPTECDTNMAIISGIASAALAASPAVKTFVIGVFSANETATAQPNLDQIATAGGTAKAFIVKQGASTTADFIAAMNTIRGTALPCDYVLPVPEAGTPDYDKLNVQHTAPDGKKTVYPNTKDAASCGAGGGWYYDVDPASGGTPTKIVLCATTCQDVKGKGGQVDVVVGCKTQTNVR